MNKDVVVDVSYVGDQPLISVLESNLDLERVSINRNPMAVKAVIPISLVIITTSFYLFEKLILDPVLDPIAKKFNWFEATKKLLRPHQPFNIAVQIEDNDFIVAPLSLDHDSVAKIWQYIRQTIDMLDLKAYSMKSLRFASFLIHLVIPK